MICGKKLRNSCQLSGQGFCDHLVFAETRNSDYVAVWRIIKYDIQRGTRGAVHYRSYVRDGQFSDASESLKNISHSLRGGGNGDTLLFLPPNVSLWRHNATRRVDALLVFQPSINEVWCRERS